MHLAEIVIGGNTDTLAGIVLVLVIVLLLLRIIGRV